MSLIKSRIGGKMGLEEIKERLKESGIDGWLFYDFHNRDRVAYRILGLDESTFTSRRWFYYVPVEGEPVKIVSGVEQTRLDVLPGEKLVYRKWSELEDSLRKVLKGARKVAMQYSPMNNIPYISIVDAGTVELVRSFGVEVVSSANLVQIFEALIDQGSFETHRFAGIKIQQIKDEAFALIGEILKAGKKITEYEVQQFIVRRFAEEGLTDDGDHPIVGVNEHPADPHFAPTQENSYVIKYGDKILIDLWARLDEPGSIYYDITWCGFAGDDPPEDYERLFRLVCEARDKAVDFIKRKLASQEKLFGYEVDDVARGVIEEAGFGEYFVHRTGHSIGTEVHGNGVNIDNFETKDDREIVPGLCFSIEPGIYIPGQMGVRTEIDVYINTNREVVIVGDIQTELIKL